MKTIKQVVATVKASVRPVCRFAWLGLIGALFCLAQGCSSTMTLVEMADQGIITHEAIQYQSVDLKAKIVVKEVRSATAANGFLVRDVIFKNIKNSQQTVWYKVEWKDDKGMQIHSSLYSWQMLRLMAQGEHTDTFTAPNASARSIHIQISPKNPN